MKSRSFVAKVDDVFPIYIHKKNDDGTITSTMAKDIEKVLIYKKSYVVQKGSVKKGDDVLVIRHGTKIGKGAPAWLGFVHNGNVRLSRKCGVTSHGVIVPNLDAKAALVDANIASSVDVSDEYFRGIDRVVLDQTFKLTKNLTKDQKREMKHCREMIAMYEKDIKNILEA